ncbi:hypothetical protein FHP25_02490 [Vineibacter terrae]|uniref:Uncharacterized protein n=1 Tax=Vineibacter terrae TaxID=2586908 RepID=A0A5C8PVB5_9HYPH|nr:hypothetical protein [Vineibacter terrae]TXL81955.1 hypothetical protein FHP25_02490 [Vineibacter terrae]
MTTIDRPAAPPMPPPPGRRVAPCLLPALPGLNAPAMLAAGLLWYAHMPVVVVTGPYDAHFVAGMGIALTAAMLGLPAAMEVADA